MKKKTGGILSHIFIDGFSGMANGLFATLIVGTILALVADLVGDIPGAFCSTVSFYVRIMANVAKMAMGAGIGIGVAKKYGASDLVTVSAAVTGFVGAFASQLLAGSGFDWSVDFGIRYMF